MRSHWNRVGPNPNADSQETQTQTHTDTRRGEDGHVKTEAEKERGSYRIRNARDHGQPEA